MVAAVISHNEAVAPRDRVKVRRAVLEYQEGALVGDRKPRRGEPRAPADKLYPTHALAPNAAPYPRGCFQAMLADERLRPAPRLEPSGAAGADVTTGVWCAHPLYVHLYGVS